MLEYHLPWLALVVEWLATILLLGLVAAIVVLAVLYWRDRLQREHAIRHNYPLIGRLRYWFEDLGTFFRQYFFALDREEMPFNRAERAWVYRSAKNLDATIAFGSSMNISRPGQILFANGAFPSLHEDFSAPGEVVIGPTCREPYRTSSLFNISGMSYGAISRPAVTALSHGAAKAGCWLNTGEGGLSPYHLEGGCDLVMQIGTAKYGVRDAEGQLSDQRLAEIAAYPQVRMFELKLSQGAKPGKGGILPGIKVTSEIAAIRGIPEGKDSISPNGHPDIRCNDDLIDRLVHIREVTGKPVGFKAVLGDERWIDEFLRSVVQHGADCAPDFITIDSGDGGSGAAPQTLMDCMGLTVRESLPLVVDKLCEYGLRDRVRVIVSGKLINPAGVAWALCMGADFIVTARGFMFALGCIQSLQCNRNTCPTGVATHNPKLQAGLDPVSKAERVFHYARNMVQEVGVIAHSCGVPEPRLLRRHHARMVVENGRSVSLDQLYPHVQPRPVLESRIKIAAENDSSV